MNEADLNIYILDKTVESCDAISNKLSTVLPSAIVNAFTNSHQMMEVVFCSIPDIILVDCNIINPSAPQLIRKIRSINHDVMIFVMTSSYSVDSVISSIKAGANNLCMKTDSCSLLWHTLESYLEVRKRRGSFALQS